MSSTSNRFVRFFGLDRSQPELSVTSWFVSPKVLLAYRVVIGLYCWAAFIGSWIYFGTTGRAAKFTVYFTHQSFLGLTFYMSTACYHSIQYVRTGAPTSFKVQGDVLTYMFFILYDTIITYHIVVPIVFWTLLSGSLLHSNPPAPPVEWWYNISVHALDFVFMLFEVLLNRHKPSWRQIWFPVSGMILYMFFSWIIHAEYGFWVYGFLDWSQGLIAIPYYLGVALVGFLAFAIMRGVHEIRDCAGARTNRGKEELEMKSVPVPPTAEREAGEQAV